VGDPVSIGEYPQTLNDVDVTATGLLDLITSGFNEGRDRRGSTIGEPTSFFVGAAVAPSAADPAREARLLRRKVSSGAGFLLSQPVYDVRTVRELRSSYEREAGEPLSVPLIAGVLPLVNGRHAEFLHNEVPGIAIPAEVRDRMRRAGEDAWAAGRAIAAETIAELRVDGVSGVYLMPQFGRYDLAAEVVEDVRS
jgi:methionine synthase / methylenetetrahydrofolate reductase(NADPH)